MRVLAATSRTQGDQPGDYTHCIPGELLWVTDVCGRDRRDPARGCGCGRGFGGLTSHRATTTAEVVECEYTEEELALAVRTSLTDQGWLSPAMDRADADGIVDDVIGGIRMIASWLPPGTIVRRDLDDFHAYPPR